MVTVCVFKNACDSVESGATNKVYGSEGRGVTVRVRARPSARASVDGEGKASQQGCMSRLLRLSRA